MNTTEQKHTPGPLTAKWLCEALLVYRDHGGVPTQELVAEILRRSAAPDLLEALRRAASAIPGIASHGKYYAEAVVADIRAEIAKAEKGA